MMGGDSVPSKAVEFPAGFLMTMFSPMVLPLAVIVILFLWYKLADADLTLLAVHKFCRNKREKYRGRVVWITGASSGIGEEVAYAFAKLGARLVLSGTRKAALEEVRLGCLSRGAPEVLIVDFNVANIPSHEASLAKVLQSMGSLNILVNNAGRLQRAEFIASSVQVEKELFDVNVFGITNLCRVVVKHWLSTQQDVAELFVTSSAAGKMGSPFSAAYAGSKHALHGYLETLRDELSCIDSHIKITIGCPGPVRSNLRLNALTEKQGQLYNRPDETAKRKLMATSRCADLIVSGLANSLDELWIADQPLLALFYIYQYLPSTFRLFLIKFIMTKKQLEKFRQGE